MAFNAHLLDYLLEDLSFKTRQQIEEVRLFREGKVGEGEGEGRALEELKARGYQERYLGRFREVYLIGIEFSKAKRNIVSYE